MTKVEHTKTHKVTIPRFSPDDCNNLNILVTDAELMLVETYSGGGKWIEVNGRLKKPILISRTEKTVQGEVCYSPTQKQIGVNGNSWEDTNCKILALPEHFSPQQLQQIVDGKLKEGKYLVECEKLPLYSSSGKEFGAKEYAEKYQEFIIKLNPHITIYPVEGKVYTREEVHNLMMQAWINGEANKDAHYAVREKWIEQNIEVIKGLS